MNASWRRRKKDPYAESLRERHVLGISRAKRWTRRLVFLAALYELYLLGVWWLIPWGEIVNTPRGPVQTPEFSLAEANSLIPNLLLSLLTP